MPFSPKSIVSKAVHGGEARRYAPRGKRVASAPVVGGIAPSIGYVYEDTTHLDSALGGDPDLYVYGRYGNPTVAAFERAVVELECHDMPERADEHFALATGSGMAAVNLAMAACGVEAGATVAAAQDCYGATYSLVDKLWPQYGVKGVFVDATDLTVVERMLAQERPLVLIVETISNPLLKVVDIARLAELCRAHNTFLLVDNTFATPMLFRPLVHGVDVVIHSATKYIGGHGDVLGGVVTARNEMRPAFWEYLKKTGANLGPHEAWLLHRGLKTMPLRVERQCRNACVVAEQLSRHPALACVRYPGLPDHPQHALAGRLFEQRGYGAVVAIELKDAVREDVFRFLEALQMVQPATTVGDLYSLALYPSHASHRALSSAQRAAVGISDGLVRLAVGVEEPQDIVADICAALES
jgi:cystathionine beta-lyase/cystathionine gamma-synthase